jgi:hypothetical protein
VMGNAGMRLRSQWGRRRINRVRARFLPHRLQTVCFVECKEEALYNLTQKGFRGLAEAETRVASEV